MQAFAGNRMSFSGGGSGTGVVDVRPTSATWLPRLFSSARRNPHRKSLDHQPARLLLEPGHRVPESPSVGAEVRGCDLLQHATSGPRQVAVGHGIGVDRSGLKGAVGPCAPPISRRGTGLRLNRDQPSGCVKDKSRAIARNRLTDSDQRHRSELEYRKGVW